MLRIEAGLALIDVEWHNSRLAFTDAERVTPKELGWGWMLRGVRDGDRAFVGSDAIRRELVDGTSRWATIGIVVDWADWDALYREAGLLPPKSRAGRSPTSRCCTTTSTRRSATARASSTHPCSSATSGWPGCSPTAAPLPAPSCASSIATCCTTTPRSGRTHHEAAVLQPGAGRQHEHRALDADDVRRDRRRRRPQRAGQRAPTSPRPACARWSSSERHLVGGAAITEELVPGFSFTTFSYALSLLRPGDHPRARPGRARVHAADDAVVVPPDGRRRLPAARRRPRPEHPGDQAALARTTPTPTTATTTTSTGSARRSGRSSTTRRRTSSARTPRTRPT